jgi:hypothetical protein
VPIKEEATAILNPFRGVDNRIRTTILKGTILGCFIYKGKKIFPLKPVKTEKF